MRKQTYTAAQFVAAATDPTAATETLELPRLEGRQAVRLFCKAETGQTATFSLLAGVSSAGAVVVASTSSVGLNGTLLQSDSGPFDYVAVKWASLTGGSVSVEATALDLES